MGPLNLPCARPIKWLIYPALLGTQFKGEMGGTKKLSKFIVDWENGTRVACNNDAIEREMCINFAQLYLRDG